MTHDYIRWLQKMAERSKAIIKLAKEGVTQADIARRMKISRQRVHQILKAAKK